MNSFIDNFKRTHLIAFCSHSFNFLWVGGGGGLWGKEGGILDGDDDDDDCGCHGLPADPGGGNDNWHSNSRIDGNEALVFGTEFSEIC